MRLFVVMVLILSLCGTAFALRMEKPPTFDMPWTQDQVQHLNDILLKIWYILNGRIDRVQKLKIGDLTNYTEIKNDGEINLHGTARVYQNEWITPQGFAVPGTKPAAATDWGISWGWEFTDGTDDTIYATVRLPQDMDKTVAPEFKIGWASADTTGDVVWQVEYLYSAQNGDTTKTDDTITEVSTVSAVANGLTIATFDDMAAPSTTDQLLMLRIKRLGDDGDDDLGDDCTLLGSGLKYTVDKLGVAY